MPAERSYASIVGIAIVVGVGQFGCIVAGHYEAGMKGKLVIGAPAGSR